MLFLIPFYIFTYESEFNELEQNEKKLEAMRREYKLIKERLDQLVREDVIDEFYRGMIAEMSERVLVNLAQNYRKIRERMGNVMVGRIIETETERIWNAAKKEENEKTKLEDIQNLTQSTGWTVQQAMDALKIPEKMQAGYAKQLEQIQKA